MSPSLSNASLRPEDLARLKVLVVDDNFNIQHLIGDVLRAGGVGQVETANDGLQAQDAISRFDPHIIFSDWQMPLMGGLELTRWIRRAALQPDRRIPNPQAPVILLTGRRSEADVQVARKAGVNEFVIKPFTPANLFSRIQLVLLKPRPFIVSESYIGPDRRRRDDPEYIGPMRRTQDAEVIIDQAEYAAARDEITAEIEALNALMCARGVVDGEVLKMIHQVMLHASFRARQVREPAVLRASMLLLEYVDGMGGHENCEPELLEVHIRAIAKLLQAKPAKAEDAEALVTRLEAVVRQKIAARIAA